MAMIVTYDPSLTPFMTAFVSEQDNLNYSTLKKKISDENRENNLKNIYRFLEGKKATSFKEKIENKYVHQLEQELLPKKLCVIDHDTINDYSHYMHHLYVVSERFKTIIESIEPDVHYFAPLELIDKHGGFVAQHYIFQVMGVVDAIDSESEGIRINIEYPGDDRYDDKDYFIYKTQYGIRKMHKSVLDGVACFRDYRWQIAVDFFVTDDVHQQMLAQGLLGMTFGDHFQEV